MISELSTRAKLLSAARGALGQKRRVRDWAIDYVLHVLEAKDWNMSQLATAAGVAASTINRPLREPDYPHKLSRTTLAKIHAASGIDPAPFIPEGAPQSRLFPANAQPPGATGMSEPPPRLRVMADGRRNQLTILIDGPVVRIEGTLDKEGIARLRERLDHIAVLLTD